MPAPFPVESESRFYAGTAMGVYRKSKSDAAWVPVSQGLDRTPWALVLAVSGTDLFAGTSNQEVWRRCLFELASFGPSGLGFSSSKMAMF